MSTSRSPDLLVHHPQGLGVLGGDDDAAGVPVDAVAQGGGEGILLPGVPLLFLIEVGLDVGEQGVDPLVLVRMDHQSRAFVHQQKVLVLVDDVQLGLEDRTERRFPGWGVSKNSSLMYSCSTSPTASRVSRLAPLPLTLDPLDADVFLSQGGGQEGQGLGQPPVQPLAGVVGAYGEFPHGSTTFLR